MRRKNAIGVMVMIAITVPTLLYGCSSKNVEDTFSGNSTSEGKGIESTVSDHSLSTDISADEEQLLNEAVGIDNEAELDLEKVAAIEKYKDLFELVPNAYEGKSIGIKVADKYIFPCNMDGVEIDDDCRLELEAVDVSTDPENAKVINSYYHYVYTSDYDKKVIVDNCESARELLPGITIEKVERSLEDKTDSMAENQYIVNGSYLCYLQDGTVYISDLQGNKKKKISPFDSVVYFEPTASCGMLYVCGEDVNRKTSVFVGDKPVLEDVFFKEVEHCGRYGNCVVIKTVPERIYLEDSSFLTETDEAALHEKNNYVLGDYDPVVAEGNPSATFNFCLIEGEHRYEIGQSKIWDDEMSGITAVDFKVDDEYTNYLFDEYYKGKFVCIESYDATKKVLTVKEIETEPYWQGTHVVDLKKSDEKIKVSDSVKILDDMSGIGDYAYCLDKDAFFADLNMRNKEVTDDSFKYKNYYYAIIENNVITTLFRPYIGP